MVVESPNKARTIGNYLGDGYIVESSIGHIRDLPRGAADVPAKYKGEPWARLGVDTEHDFEPLYIVTPDKKAQVAKLKALLAGATELYLATDEDREGEAIAWHLLQTLQPKVPVKRMVFHEITPAAIRAAAESPRELDVNLVDAQETRRILDRLYGYEVSPVLWKKVMPKLSAGRVQSVATRIIVERERARMAFVSGSYWGLDAMFTPTGATEGAFTAALSTVDGRRLAVGRDFDPATGRLSADAARADVLQLDEDGATTLAGHLRDGAAVVTSVEEKPYTRRPYAPFMTSTLQQEAGRKLGFSSERTMRTAQKLYESGYITYMRTDSTTLSQTALDAARAQARELYGPEYVPAQPRQYTKKVKNAQEAHEAIRPAGESFRTPGQVANALGADEFRVYELIWQRTIASQMVDAKGQTLTVKITAPAGDASCVFTSSGRTITFPGFLRAYVETVDAEAGGEADDAERRLPNLQEGQQLSIGDLTPGAHFTNPPARYTEPSLIKALEDLGIGRPSTYASIIRTITDRGYVWRKGQALVPSWIAFAVVGLLEQHFARLVDYDFTAAMEDELDSIAEGRLGRTAWLKSFYYGGEIGPEGGVGRSGGLKKLVGDRLEDIDAREVNSLPLLTGADGRKVLVRVGRYGPYLERDGLPGDDGAAGPAERANLPEELAPDEVTAEVAEDLFAQAEIGDKVLGTDPGSGREIVAKDGRYGPYVTEILPEGTPDHGQERRQAADRVTVQDDDGGDGGPGHRIAAAHPAAGGRGRSGHRRGDHRAERPVRALPEEGHRFAVVGRRGVAVQRHAGRGAGALRAAEDPGAHGGRGVIAPGRRRRSGHRQADGDQGRQVRAVRHRRGDERIVAQGRRGGHADHRPGGGAALRAAGPRAGPEEDHHPEGAGRREERRRTQDHHPEARSQDRTQAKRGVNRGSASGGSEGETRVKPGRSGCRAAYDRIMTSPMAGAAPGEAGFAPAFPDALAGTGGTADPQVQTVASPPFPDPTAEQVASWSYWTADGAPPVIVGPILAPIVIDPAMVARAEAELARQAEHDRVDRAHAVAARQGAVQRAAARSGRLPVQLPAQLQNLPSWLPPSVQDAVRRGLSHATQGPPPGGQPGSTGYTPSAQSARLTAAPRRDSAVGSSGSTGYTPSVQSTRSTAAPRRDSAVGSSGSTGYTPSVQSTQVDRRAAPRLHRRYRRGQEPRVRRLGGTGLHRGRAVRHRNRPEDRLGDPRPDQPVTGQFG